ncbi:hypothetical protein [Leptospira ilyithenensis]|uniref:Glycosyltransferase RgtA/B/C/D-like domain-containing protein n=1 Tax=Leptospira ilyithenensis TaxID=2484901 RepID=A0A4R9LKG6_9LEPT|nr:hypothetical protein [Leptospira ilyithenensis]TGN08022.1 hypothetical protein EHS11_13880 [Leptospira ilyithenensis]
MTNHITFNSVRSVFKNIPFEGLLIFFVTYLTLGYYSFYGLDTYHEGTVFKPSLDVYNGRKIFLETFSHYGALSTYFNAWGMFLLGPYLSSVRLTIVFAYSISFFILFSLFKLYFGRTIAYMLVILGICSIPFVFVCGSNLFLSWSSIYCLPFQSYSLYLIFTLNRKNGFRNSFFIGICTGILFHIKQPVGATLLLALFCANCFYFFQRLLFSFKKGRWNGFVFQSFVFAGFIVINAVMLLLFYSQGNLSSYWEQNIVYALTGAASVQGSFGILLQNLFPGFSHAILFFSVFLAALLLIQNRVLLFFFLSGLFLISNYFFVGLDHLFPLFICGSLLIFLLKMNAVVKPLGAYKYLIFLAFITASWSQFHPNPTPYHRSWSVFPALCVVIIFLKQLTVKSFHLKMALLLLLILSVIYKLEQVVALPVKSFVHVNGGILNGLYVETHTYQSLLNAEAAMKKATLAGGYDENPPVINATNNPYISLLTFNPFNYDPTNFFWLGLPFKLYVNSKSDLTDLLVIRPVIITQTIIGQPFHISMEEKIKKLGFYMASKADIEFSFTPTRELKFWVLTKNSNRNKVNH